jgi:hypothetical protein
MVRRSRWTGLYLAATAIVAISATWSAAASPAQAVSRHRANRLAIRVLKPARQPQPVKVLGLRKPLRAGALAYESSTRRGKKGRLHPRPLRRRAWLFWEDLAPGAPFAHAGVLLLLDARSGRTVRRVKTSWFPSVNGKTLRFLRSAAAYTSPRLVVYASPRAIATPAASRRGGGPTASASAYAQAKNRSEDLKNDCLVTIGNSSDPIVGPDKTAMDKFANAVGLKKFEAQPTVKSLRETVAVAIRGDPGESPCKDVMLFVYGHGRPPAEYWEGGVRKKDPGGGEPAGVEVRHKEKVGDDGKVVNDSTYITPQDLIDLVKQYEGNFGVGGVDFKIKIDACFAGRFERVFRETSNVAAMEMGAAADETGWNFQAFNKQYDTREVADPVTHLATKVFKTDDTDNPDGATTFTNANVQGLMSWAATAPAGEDLLKGFIASMSLGDGYDFAENINYTHPLELIRGLPPIILPNISCGTTLVNEGTPNEVISNTSCSGTTFNGLLFTPQNGNSIVAFFPESSQASCSLQGASLYCGFPAQVSNSGPIDIRFGSPPSATSPNLEVRFSTDGGANYGAPFFSSGP